MQPVRNVSLNVKTKEFASKNNVFAKALSEAPNVKIVSLVIHFGALLTAIIALTIESQTPYLSAAIFIFLSFTFGLTCIGVC